MMDHRKILKTLLNGYLVPYPDELIHWMANSMGLSVERPNYGWRVQGSL